MITTMYGRDGKHRAVRAETMAEAAGVFAARRARATYGRKGYVRTMRRDSGAQDGSSATFEAFIGRDAKGGGTTGHNVWVTVYKR